MAEEKKSIEISYKANLSDLKAKLKSIPNITDQEAKKMVAALDRQLKQAEKAAKRASQASQKAARASSKAAKRGKVDFDKLASSASMVGASFAVMGAGVLAFSQQLADLTNQLTDASAKSGIAVETLAGLRLAAEGSGMEFGNLESGLIRFQTSVLDASRGSKSMTENFKALGVEVKNTDGSVRDADSVFNDAIRSLGEMENTTERNALAMKLFGREGGAGLIQSGALDNLGDMTALAKQFGVALDEEAIKKMGDFQREMAEFDAVSQGVFQNLIKSIGGADLTIRDATKTMIFLGSITEDIIGGIGQTFENAFGGMQGSLMLASGDLKGALALTEELFGDTKETFSDLGNMFANASEKVDEFNRLTEQDAENQKKSTEEAKKRTDQEERKKEAIKAAVKAQKEFLKLQQNIREESREIVNLVGERVTSEYQKQVNSIKELGIEIEDHLGLLEVEKASLESLAETRKLNSAEALNLRSIQRQIGELEEAQAENKKAELEALRQLYREQHNERMEQNNKIHQARMEQLQQEQEKSIELASETFGAYSNMLNGIADLVENNSKEEGKAAVKVFALRQGAAIAETAMNTAKGIVNALATYPGPGGIALASIIGATGATQMAAIASQQPPSFHMGGMLANDEMGARVLRGEAVLDRATVRRIGGEEGVKKLQQGNGTGDNVMVIQPFKHFGRFAREIGFKPPRKTGIRK